MLWAGCGRLSCARSPRLRAERLDGVAKVFQPNPHRGFRHIEDPGEFLRRPCATVPFRPYQGSRHQQRRGKAVGLPFQIICQSASIQNAVYNPVADQVPMQDVVGQFVRQGETLAARAFRAIDGDAVASARSLNFASYGEIHPPIMVNGNAQSRRHAVQVHRRGFQKRRGDFNWRPVFNDVSGSLTGIQGLAGGAGCCWFNSVTVALIMSRVETPIPNHVCP